MDTLLPETGGLEATTPAHNQHLDLSFLTSLISQDRKQRMSKPGERLSLSLNTASLPQNYSQPDAAQSPTSVQPNQEPDWPLPNPLTSKPRRECETESVDFVQKEELTQDDVIIAVMGPTGAGKSTFIQTVTGRDNGVGHSLTSCTSQVSAVRVTFKDHVTVVLVDTPGFDDTHLSDLEVLKIIAEWLKEVRRGKFGLSGILYLHRISDNRMAGTPLKNLAMFRKLCGEDFFKRVILTTTMWPNDGDPEYTLCVGREKELQKDYWAEMIKRGSRTLRFKNTKESARNVLDQFIIAESSRRCDALALRIQQELVDEKKKIPRTEAGQQLHGLIEELVVKQNDVLRRLKDELGKTADPKFVEALLEELGQLRRERENAIKDKRQLELSLLARMFRVFPFKRARRQQIGPHSQEHQEASLDSNEPPASHTAVDPPHTGPPTDSNEPSAPCAPVNSLNSPHTGPSMYPNGPSAPHTPADSLNPPRTGPPMSSNEPSAPHAAVDSLNSPSPGPPVDPSGPPAPYTAVEPLNYSHPGPPVNSDTSSAPPEGTKGEGGVATENQGQDPS